MRTLFYPSDITDAQWALIKDCIPVYPGGRPRKTVAAVGARLQCRAAGIHDVFVTERARGAVDRVRARMHRAVRVAAATIPHGLLDAAITSGAYTTPISSTSPKGDFRSTCRVVLGARLLRAYKMCRALAQQQMLLIGCDARTRLRRSH